MAEIELDSNPESTWGATPEYIAAWTEKYGNEEPAPAKSQSPDVSGNPETAPAEVGQADTGTPTSAGTAKGR